MIKIILLDVDNTLLDFNKCAEYAMRAACKKMGVEFFGGMTVVFHEINNRLWLGIEKGEITKAQLHRNRWRLPQKSPMHTTSSWKWNKATKPMWATEADDSQAVSASAFP